MFDHEIHDMKRAKKYVKRMCNQIADRFVGITIRCQYKDASQTHLLEITPQHIADSLEFEQVAEPLLFEFYGRFPEENLCFISDDSLARITKPEYVITIPRIDELALESVFAFRNVLWEASDLIGLARSAFRVAEAEQSYVTLKGAVESGQAGVFVGGWWSQPHELLGHGLGSEVRYQFDLGRKFIWLQSEASQFSGSQRLAARVSDEAKFWPIDNELLELSSTESFHIALAS